MLILILSATNSNLLANSICERKCWNSDLGTVFFKLAISSLFHAVKKNKKNSNHSFCFGCLFYYSEYLYISLPFLNVAVIFVKLLNFLSSEFHAVTK